MAERVTVESVLKKISQRHLECHIGMDRFKEPKMLECSHSYCLECLQQLAETTPTSRKFILCPVCRAETSLIGKEVSDLRTDFKLTSMLDDIEQHETELQKEIQPPGQGSDSKCSNHTGKDVIMYCDSCKELICTTCIAKDHKMHDHLELNEVIDNCKKKANEILAAVGKHHNYFKIAMKDIGTSRKTLDSMFVATKAKISKKADEEIAKESTRIREEENKLIEELTKTYKDKATEMEIAEATNNNEMTKAQNGKVLVNQLMVKVNFFENLRLIENLLQDLKDYIEIKPKQLPSNLTFDLEDDQKSFGRLRIKEKQKQKEATFAAATACKPRTKLTWTLKTEMTRCINSDQQKQTICALDAASYCNSDVVVCNYNGTLIKVFASSNQSKVIPKELSIAGLNNPSRVTVNKKDELIVVDNTAVRIFNRKYIGLHQFTHMHPFFQPSCIAVDDDNLISVGYEFQGEINQHKSDGSLIRTLPAPGINNNLTVHKRQLIYTKTKNGKQIVSIDYNGGIVFSVDINQSTWPCGLCSDKDGSIFVAVFDKSSSSKIQHYSHDGEYMGCIIKGCARPNALTITPAGDLVVASGESIQVYCHDRQPWN
ncbi:uncharacterized protein [Asterias amurensis]|uniref:uncharacterized protein n=1 Tax=Asterias amurensis TaxID=7602 RepID=UPI003AB1483D